MLPPYLPRRRATPPTTRTRPGVFARATVCRKYLGPKKALNLLITVAIAKPEIQCLPPGIRTANGLRAFLFKRAEQLLFTSQENYDRVFRFRFICAHGGITSQSIFLSAFSCGCTPNLCSTRRIRSGG